MGSCGDLRRRRRVRLMAEDPHCWYCGIELVWIEGLGRTTGPPPRNLAVLETATPRIHSEDGKQHGVRDYLSCLDCAMTRSGASYKLAFADPATPLGRKRKDKDDYWRAWRAEHGYPEPRHQNAS